jgi:hypothetical protein
VTRAIEAAVTAGVDIARIETDKAGKIAIIAGGGTGETKQAWRPRLDSNQRPSA